MNQYLLREKFRENPSLLDDKAVASLAGITLPNGTNRIGKFIDMDFEQLIQAGFSTEGAIVLKTIKEIATRYLSQQMEQRDAVASPTAVVNFLRARIAGLPHEAFAVVFLNTQNEVITHEVINEGTIDQVAVYPRRIIEKALQHHAAGIILAHNHPSGYTDPSEEDKRLTRTVRDACRIMDIRVCDHVIVGAAGYFSFAERGLI